MTPSPNPQREWVGEDLFKEIGGKGTWNGKSLVMRMIETDGYENSVKRSCVKWKWLKTEGNRAILGIRIPNSILKIPE